jgi:hypothetical protein
MKKKGQISAIPGEVSPRIAVQILFLMVSILFAPPLLAKFTREYGSGPDIDLKLYCTREAAYSTGVSDARKGLARKENYAEICTVTRAYLNGAYNTGYNFGLTNQAGLIINEPTPAHPGIREQLPSSVVQPYTRPVQPAVMQNEQGTPYSTPVAPKANYAPYGEPYVDYRPRTHFEESGVGNGEYRPRAYPEESDVSSGSLAKPAPKHGLQSLIEIEPSARPKCIETSTGQACGYNCINSLNNVRCATSPDQVCRSNEVGQIACGYNCVSTVKTVRCALTPTDTCVSDNNGNVFCGANCRIERNAIGVCDLERYAP